MKIKVRARMGINPRLINIIIERKEEILIAR